MSRASRLSNSTAIAAVRGKAENQTPGLNRLAAVQRKILYQARMDVSSV
jgi:hypothetical protein